MTQQIQKVLNQLSCISENGEMMKQRGHSSRTCIKNAKETENGQFKVPAIMNERKLKMSIRYESVEKLSEMIKTMRLSLQVVKDIYDAIEETDPTIKSF